MIRNTISLSLLLCFSSIVPAQQYYAFVVGVEDYIPSQLRPLEYAEDDAETLADQLKDLGYHVVLMTSNAKNPELKPTDQDAILDALDGRLRGVSKDDTLVVALTGHGVQFSDDQPLANGDRETYFCPERARTDRKDTLVPLSKEVLSRIGKCPADRKLVLIDACRNEVSPEAGDLGRRIQIEAVHEHPRHVPKGMTMLFSCSENQRAYEHNDLKHSVFSNYVIDYLGGKAGEALYDQGVPNVDGLVTYVRSNTDRFVLDNITPTGQYPQLIGGRDSWRLSGGALESAKPLEMEGTKAGQIQSFGTPAIEFCWCPAGEFKMGQPDPDDDSTFPQRIPTSVKLTHGFWIGKVKINQGTWKQVMGKYPSDRSLLQQRDPSDLPVNSMTYRDIELFCAKLTTASVAAKKLRKGWEFTAPSEAMWVYACRAGGLIDGEDAEVNPWGITGMASSEYIYEWCLDPGDFYSNIPTNFVDPISVLGPRSKSARFQDRQLIWGRTMRSGPAEADCPACHSADLNCLRLSIVETDWLEEMKQEAISASLKLQVDVPVRSD